MKTLVRCGFASSLLTAFSLLVVGCGGGGGGTTIPTATPTGTIIPTATPTTPSGGTPILANQVAFVSNRANPASNNADIYKSNLDGSNAVRLTTLNQTVDKPSVSNDGARLVFQLGESNTTGGTNNIELGIINANGSGFQRLTEDSTPAGRPDDYSPVFSPNGQYIYWTSTRRAVNENGATVDGIPHIWRMNGAVGNTGTDQQQVVAEASAYPSVDRNGNLAYVALNQTASPITLRTSAGALIKRISDSTPAAQIFDLSLSSDGSRIAFSSANSIGSTAAAQIRIYDVATSARNGNSPSGGSSNGGSAWGRDSQTLYFDAANGATSRRQIFTSPAPYSTQSQISTQTSSDNYSPAFLPVN